MSATRIQAGRSQSLHPCVRKEDEADPVSRRSATVSTYRVHSDMLLLASPPLQSVFIILTSRHQVVKKTKSISARHLYKSI